MINNSDLSCSCFLDNAINQTVDSQVELWTFSIIFNAPFVLALNSIYLLVHSITCVALQSILYSLDCP